MRTMLVRPLVGAFLLAAATAVTPGCFCGAFFDDDWNGGGGGFGDCSSDSDCWEGCICSGGECVETGWCATDADCEGAACDESRNTCMGGAPGGGTSDQCGDDQCAEGCWFDAASGVCVETMTCSSDADCSSGLVCQADRATCVPADRACDAPAPEPGECADDLCPAGSWWDPNNGGCVVTAPCAASGDPVCFSDEVCDVAESTCVPADRVCATPAEPKPTPTTCVYSVECPEGAECVDGVCTVPNTTPPGGGTTTPPACTFNYECGTDGTCVDGRCHTNCADSSTCPIGQICGGAGFCEDDPMPTPECTATADCTNGGYCVNAICYPACIADSECGAEEFCKRNVCRPDFRPRAQCLFNSECGTGEECVDAVCRLRCWGDSWCTSLGAGSVCDVAWCTFPEESSANCGPDLPCADGLSCVNGSCTAI
jgi:hypothetical protein